MRDREIQLVQESFQKIIPIEEKATKIFYNRLFELDPALRPLFPNNMEIQEEKFIHMFIFLIMGLQKIHEIRPVAQNLAVDHVSYGVKEEDYTTFKKALLDTLKAILCNDFTPEVQSAWVDAYELLSRIMKDAAREVPQSIKKNRQASV